MSDNACAFQILASGPALLDKIGKVEILFVCCGINVREAVSNPLLMALRRLGERRVGLGALCTGGYALARAGLLDHYRATIHWENLPALREEFPRVQLNDQVFSIDRDRYSASGGTAPLDLMLNLIQMKHGLRISQQVSEQFVLERVRSSDDRQYVPLRAQVGSSHRGMIQVAELMEENIEKPLSLEAMPIMDVTTSCGFKSPPHFSRCYRSMFGHPPSAERRVRR